MKVEQKKLDVVLYSVFQAESRYETGGFERDRSHPLKATTQNVQQNAKHVSATLKFMNSMTSRQWISIVQYRTKCHSSPLRPLRIAANVTSSVLKMNVSPPQARKKLPRASVGGREGRIEWGGPSQTKKYVNHRKIEKARRKYPQRAWIWT
jgi:hypothetical protein